MAVAELVAGRELDALVAEKVMGWTVQLIVGLHESFEEWRDPQGWRYGPNPPSYSTDIADAWLVVEKCPGDFELDRDFAGWDCYWASGNGAIADTAPLAICRAALAAVTH